MNRLTLDVDDLRVETFDADAPAAEAAMSGPSEPSWCRTCDGDRTCYTINCC